MGDERAELGNDLLARLSWHLVVEQHQLDGLSLIAFLDQLCRLLKNLVARCEELGLALKSQPSDLSLQHLHADF